MALNSSLCQLSFNTLIGFLGRTYAYLGRPWNFTKIEAHLKAHLYTFLVAYEQKWLAYGYLEYIEPLGNT